MIEEYKGEMRLGLIAQIKSVKAIVVSYILLFHSIRVIT